MRLTTLSGGETLHHYKKALVLSFPSPRLVCSTSPTNGGIRNNLTAVFNHDGNPGPGCQFELKADTYEEHLNVVAKELGLDPAHTTGLCTAASMDNVAICHESFKELTVSTIVTGGVKRNAARIGDPACYEQLGTINILLYISANLPEGVLERALVSCTEAKVAALQELLAPSRYSSGLATGSGTDGVIIICNPSSPLRITDAGSHGKLGELIGKVVKRAIKEALDKQSGLNPNYQFDIFNRMDRFGVTPDTMWELYQKIDGEHSLSRMLFEDLLDSKKRQNQAVVYSSLYAHLIDQLNWGLISSTDAWETGKVILGQAFETTVEVMENNSLIETYKKIFLEWLKCDIP
ncbi:protein of unknown function DUF105 [Lachnospiraceae bacterium TWA4]|nr:protein of unknown function DUF105 [Lachnospiraceae bacterium TWA4]